MYKIVFALSACQAPVISEWFQEVTLARISSISKEVITRPGNEMPNLAPLGTHKSDILKTIASLAFPGCPTSMEERDKSSITVSCNIQMIRHVLNRKHIWSKIYLKMELNKKNASSHQGGGSRIFVQCCCTNKSIKHDVHCHVTSGGVQIFCSTLSQQQEMSHIIKSVMEGGPEIL